MKYLPLTIPCVNGMEPVCSPVVGQIVGGAGHRLQYSIVTSVVLANSKLLFCPSFIYTEFEEKQVGNPIRYSVSASVYFINIA